MRPPQAILIALGLAIFLAPLTATPADAKRIEKACLESSRRSANAPLCTCIQRVADQTLTRTDQKLAAQFFTDPQKAQDIRQSDRRKHEEFWTRYRTFGSAAQKVCR